MDKTNNNPWDNLSMTDRANVISLFTKNYNITDLDEIHNLYNNVSSSLTSNTNINDNEEIYNGGTIDSAVKTEYLTKEQWANLHKQGKVNLLQVPKQYRNWVQAENHSFKQGVTDAMDNFGNKVLGAGLALGSFIPIVGNTSDIVDIGLDLASGNYLDAGITAATSFLPDFLQKPIKKGIINKVLKSELKSKRANYRIREHIRNKQLQDLMNYGQNSGILVHGDPSVTGVSRVGNAIGYHDGSPTSFPHFENGYLVPRNGGNIREYNKGVVYDRNPVIYWGDGAPFYETRVGHNDTMLQDNEYIDWLINTKDRRTMASNANDFILENPYRYIATNIENASNSKIIRDGRFNRDMTEIISERVPSDKIWGIEWSPLLQTWEKHIYSPNGVFKKYGGPLNYPFSNMPIPQVRYDIGGPINTNYNIPLVPEWLTGNNNTLLENTDTQVQVVNAQPTVNQNVQQYTWTDDDIKNLAKVFESYKDHAYLDSKGIVTGGWGHQLSKKEIEQYWNEKSKKAKGKIPIEVSEKWFEDNMQEAFNSVNHYYGDNLPSNVRAALVSLRYHGGDKMIRASRDKNGNIEVGSTWGSPNFEKAVKRYIQEPNEANLATIISEMQYKDDNDPTQMGLSDRYGLYRAMMENIADPSKVKKYKFRGTYRNYKSNKVKK